MFRQVSQPGVNRVARIQRQTTDDELYRADAGPRERREQTIVRAGRVWKASMVLPLGQEVQMTPDLSVSNDKTTTPRPREHARLDRFIDFCSLDCEHADYGTAVG